MVHFDHTHVVRLLGIVRETTHKVNRSKDVQVVLTLMPDADPPVRTKLWGRCRVTDPNNVIAFRRASSTNCPFYVDIVGIVRVKTLKLKWRNHPSKNEGGSYSPAAWMAWWRAEYYKYYTWYKWFKWFKSLSTPPPVPSAVALVATPIWSTSASDGTAAVGPVSCGYAPRPLRIRWEIWKRGHL